MGIVTTAFIGPVPAAIDKYRVEQHPPFGIAVFGMIPVNDLVGLSKAWDLGPDALVDAVLCEHLKAVWVVVRDRAASEAWRKQLGLRIDHPDWLMTGDTGISSKTIRAVMTGNWWIVHRGRDGFASPGDGDDFGRCYRLVRRFKSYRKRLGKVADACEAFRPVVEHWDELVALFEGEGELDEHGRQTKATPKTDALLARLSKGGRS